MARPLRSGWLTVMFLANSVGGYKYKSVNDSFLRHFLVRQKGKLTVVL